MPNQAVVFPEPRTVILEDRERPEPNADEVLIETKRTLISTGTELTILSGEFPDGSFWDDYGQFPFVSGYSNVGEVIEAGPEAVFEEGTIVASRGPHQQYVTASADRATAVPDGVPAEEATFFALAAITMNGVRQGDVEWGDAVAIYGLGLLGQLATRWCRFAGARPVVTFEIAPERLAYLPDDRTGIVTANPRTEDAAGIVAERNRGRLADVVFEVTGLPDVIPGQFDVLRQQGRMVVLSSPRGRTTLDLHDHCNGPGYEIVGAHERTHPPESTYRDPWNHGRHHELFFDLLDRGEVEVGSLISHRVPYEEAPETFENLLQDRSEAMGVVIEWDP